MTEICKIAFLLPAMLANPFKIRYSSTMTQTEQKKRAKQFAARWQGRGYEKGETQKFWIDLFTSVFGVENCTDFIFFEEQVKEKIQNKTVTNFIDAYIKPVRKLQFQNRLP